MTLIQPALSRILIYFLSVFITLVFVSKSLGKTMRDFLLEGVDEGGGARR